ncbi:MAG TPA: haloacid dehalogenase [Dehalococcoidales bacterium]|nr:haloacid dehalogenase [Dehalococcoidales bacterium]
MTDNLDSIANEIRQSFMAKDGAREKVLPLCREAIRHCGNAIRAVHRQQFDQAIELLMSARQLLDKVEQATAEYPELSSSGLVRDAQKEFAEGSTTLAMITRQPLPTPAELRVDQAAYLNGLGEAVGELRRYLLDSMRRGDLSRGEELLTMMDDIYNTLFAMDFPDAITGGLRHTTDSIRGIMERTRSDLTLAISQKDLEEKLKSQPPK